MSFLNDQTPEAKRTRQIIAVGVGGLVALIFLMNRNRQPAAADGELAGGIAGASVPSTFADNGEAMSDLSTQVAGGLGEVSSALDDVGSSQSALADALAELKTPAAVAAPAAIAASGSPAPPARTTYKGQPGSWSFKNGRWTWVPAAGTHPKGLGTAAMNKAAKKLGLKGKGGGLYVGKGGTYKWTGHNMALVKAAPKPKPKPKPKAPARGRR